MSVLPPWVAGSRYRVLLWVGILMLSLSLATRLGLLWYDGDSVNYAPGKVAEILAVGLVYDLAALSWLLIPFSLLAWLSGAGPWGRSIHAGLASTLYAFTVVGLVFQTVAEFIFWNEFSARFNFIAVDYLVFTREVVGNIRESYPLAPILWGIAAVSLVILLLTIRPFWRASAAAAPRMSVRFVVFLALSMLPALAYFGADESLHRQIERPSTRELASNGLYSLFRAFFNNELSYAQYYQTLNQPEVDRVLEEELLEAHAAGRHEPRLGPDPLARHIPADGPAVGRNLVLVSIESLGSDYVESFQGKPGLTPNLDALTRESLIFTNLYATGLRTVRGLEAITLSVPPTPGRAVPMREHNKGLPTLGGVLKQQVYDVLYLYGGYSLFDNMQDFFGGNGYEVIDRTAIADDEISHETIWGVADENLYQLSLRELDTRYAEGKRFFAHIMTTSNHRPYTYPDGRVSIPSHSGRDGAVQYTDWAIGEFLKEARKRPWYENTMFVFLADHTSHGRGRIDLPPKNYRIPMWIHAPGLVEPGRVDAVASQIDVAPTLLALLNVEYDSHFFGQDILHEANYHPRAFMANYLTVGYMERGLIVELGPRDYVRVVNAETGQPVASDDPLAAELIREAISYYQSAEAYIDDKTGKAPNATL